MAYLKFKPITSKLNFYKTLTAKEAEGELDQILEPHEDIITAFKSIRDIGIFTDKRIILIDKKGFGHVRKSIISIKYSSISSYSLNIHTIDSAIELVFDSGYKLMINFLKPISLDDMYKVYKYISDFVLNKVR
jgi:hypothetical protein